MMVFWAEKIFSGGSSVPKSPLATMTASASLIISSILSSPSWFSTFATIPICLPSQPNTLLTSLICEAFLMKDAATKSISLRTANLISSLSFLETMIIIYGLMYLRVGQSSLQESIHLFFRTG